MKDALIASVRYGNGSYDFVKVTRGINNDITVRCADGTLVHVNYLDYAELAIIAEGCGNYEIAKEYRQIIANCEEDK